MTVGTFIVIGSTVALMGLYFWVVASNHRTRP